MKKLNGRKMLDAAKKSEEKCEHVTEKRLSRMGKKAPVCYDLLRQVLAYADMIGSCSFGCPGQSQSAHALWYLTARTSSFGRAALRLARMGFYDEALIIVRSMGEIANLFALFAAAPEAIEEWKAADRLGRITRFSPVKIRERLACLGELIPMDKTKYESLCEWSTHPVPDMQPQKFNHAGKSMTGGIHFQAAGFLVVLNEMAIIESLLVFYAAKSCGVARDVFQEIGRACKMCAMSAGGIDLQGMERLWRETKVLTD